MKTYFEKIDSLGFPYLIMFVDGVAHSVPSDPSNSDYAEYLAWVAEGNTAEEWSPDATV
jgi:hypothetical protein